MKHTQESTVQPKIERPIKVNTSLVRIKDEDFGYPEARHLLLRAGFGGTDEQIRTLASWGPEAAVDHLLDYRRYPGRSRRTRCVRQLDHSPANGS